MIIDLERFAAAERHYWDELAEQLDRLEGRSHYRLDLPQAERLHYLYQRAVGDLARLATFSAEPELRRSLGALVARAYAEIQSDSGRAGRLRPWRWLRATFPQTFRRHVRAFWLALAVTLAGAGFGAVTVALDDEAREIIVPPVFSHLLGDPKERVAREEKKADASLEGHATFSAQLMANNIQVSIQAMAYGALWAVGTLVMLFYNGVILGVVCFDYLRAGEGLFLTGWLLPHGSVEIPAILLAGQAGLVLGGAVIGWGRRTPLAERLRAGRADVVTLLAGAALMLVWAGLVESFFSQYHAPVLPYSVKIAFGAVELTLLTLFLWRAGRDGSEGEPAKAGAVRA